MLFKRKNSKVIHMYKTQFFYSKNKKMEPTALRTVYSTRKTKIGCKHPIFIVTRGAVYPLGRSGSIFFTKKMEPTVGIEPTTYGLQNRCSAS